LHGGTIVGDSKRTALAIQKSDVAKIRIRGKQKQQGDLEK
jgi:hypothetical protein